MPNETPEPNPPAGPQAAGESAPLVLIPVTAEDVFRRKVRIVAWISVSLLVVVSIIVVTWKRSTNPIHAQEAFDSGQRFLKVAHYNEAALSFDRAIALKPDLVDAYFLRGRAYVGLSDAEKSIRDFSMVLELRPAHAPAYKERGGVYLGKKDYQRAFADLTKALELNPHYAEAFNLRGIAWREQGQLDRSLQDLNRAVEIAPDADNCFQRGSTYQMMGEHRRAIADFDRVIAFKPDVAHTYFARSQSRRAIGDLAGARADHRTGRILDGR